MTTQLLLLPALYLLAPDADRLTVYAEPAPASVAAQAEGRRLLQLPDLEYRLRIRKHCAGGRRAESVSISVADTRRTLNGDALHEEAEIETTLRIGAGQLAPIALRSFCVAGDDNGRTLLVQSVLTANASLRCAGDDGESIFYTSTTLDVAIHCEAPAEESVP